jgi:hypothetical protein
MVITGSKMMQISDIVFIYLMIERYTGWGKYNVDVGCIMIICLDALSVLRIKS